MKKIILSTLLLLNLVLNAQCWKTVSTGADFCIAIKEDGTLWAWGHNDNGQLGIGTNPDQKIPTQVGADSDWKSLSAGYGFTVALKTNGTLWVWGRNDFGLGNDPSNPANIPSQVGTETDWKFVTTGGAHTLAIKNNGTLWGWGRNDFGQLGNGTFGHTNVPIQAGTANDWETATAGTFHSLAIKTNQTLWSWGYNFHGQLGHGTAGFGTEVNTPTQIAALAANQWKCIATGGRHSMAITETGNLWVWGNNNSYALGLNDGSFYKSVPTRLGNATNWKSAIGGYDHTFAIKEDHTLWAWGANTDGQLGDGSFTNRAAPVQVNTVANWEIADGGLQHSAFLKDGDIFTTGRNNYGELGINSVVAHNSLQLVSCPTLGIEGKVALPFVFYPNPVKETLWLQNPHNLSIDEIQVIDMTGKTVLQNSKADSTIDVQKLQSGMYWLRIFSGAETHQLKFIKI